MFETSYELDDVGKIKHIPKYLFYPNNKWSIIDRRISMVIKVGRRTLALYSPDEGMRRVDRKYADKLFKDQGDAIKAFMK